MQIQCSQIATNLGTLRTTVNRSTADRNFRETSTRQVTRKHDKPSSTRYAHNIYLVQTTVAQEKKPQSVQTPRAIHFGPVVFGAKTKSWERLRAGKKGRRQYLALCHRCIMCQIEKGPWRNLFFFLCNAYISNIHSSYKYIHAGLLYTCHCKSSLRYL